MNPAKLLGVLLLLCAIAPVAGAQTVGKQKDWDELLAAAKKEGKVVVMGSPDPGFDRQSADRNHDADSVRVWIHAGEQESDLSSIRG